MNFPRASGILLHPTSLPGRFGIGDLGPAAYEFVDILAANSQKYWQILPLSPTGYGDSPYSSISAFAGNTLLISPERLVDDGLLTTDDLNTKSDFPGERVDFGGVRVWKEMLLARAFESFRASGTAELNNEFDVFVRENNWWLDDYAIFCAFKAAHDNKPWFEWAGPLKFRDSGALETTRSQLGREILAEKFYQFIFFRQWTAVKAYSGQNGIKIIGDIPIFVALDSVDVWCNQDKFKLGDDGLPLVVAGVPPDYFSETGQLWGNPIYDWQAMLADDFGWWTARLAFALRCVDIVRLDHFIGFARNWEVPAGDETAANGKWVDVPGNAFFTVLGRRLGKLPVIAEDLGALTPEIEGLRDAFGFPGMHILQYAFGGDAHNRDLPHNYVRNCVAYTGTHDNDTSAGWYRSANKQERTACRKYLGSNGREIHWDMIRAVLASVADIAIIPQQDIFGLAGDARMNLPASSGGNWAWRMSADAMKSDVFGRLKDLTVLYGRES